MTPARWTFVAIFGGCVALGAVIGVADLIWPGISGVKLYDQPAPAMIVFYVTMALLGALGLLAGLIIAGIVALFTRKKKTA
jgi:branched-subunit amino acid permease